MNSENTDAIPIEEFRVILDRVNTPDAHRLMTALQHAQDTLKDTEAMRKALRLREKSLSLEKEDFERYKEANLQRIAMRAYDSLPKNDMVKFRERHEGDVDASPDSEFSNVDNSNTGDDDPEFLAAQCAMLYKLRDTLMDDYIASQRQCEQRLSELRRQEMTLTENVTSLQERLQNLTDRISAEQRENDQYESDSDVSGQFRTAVGITTTFNDGVEVNTLEKFTDRKTPKRDYQSSGEVEHHILLDSPEATVRSLATPPPPPPPPPAAVTSDCSSTKKSPNLQRRRPPPLQLSARNSALSADPLAVIQAFESAVAVSKRTPKVASVVSETGSKKSNNQQQTPTVPNSAARKLSVESRKDSDEESPLMNFGFRRGSAEDNRHHNVAVAAERAKALKEASRSRWSKALRKIGLASGLKKRALTDFHNAEDLWADEYAAAWSSATAWDKLSGNVPHTAMSRYPTLPLHPTPVESEYVNPPPESTHTVHHRQAKRSSATMLDGGIIVSSKDSKPIVSVDNESTAQQQAPQSSPLLSLNEAPVTQQPRRSSIVRSTDAPMIASTPSQPPTTLKTHQKAKDVPALWSLRWPYPFDGVKDDLTGEDQKMLYEGELLVSRDASSLDETYVYILADTVVMASGDTVSDAFRMVNVTVLEGLFMAAGLPGAIDAHSISLLLRQGGGTQRRFVLQAPSPQVRQRVYDALRTAMVVAKNEKKAPAAHILPQTRPSAPITRGLGQQQQLQPQHVPPVAVVQDLPSHFDVDRKPSHFAKSATAAQQAFPVTAPATTTTIPSQPPIRLEQAIPMPVRVSATPTMPVRVSATPAVPPKNRSSAAQAILATTQARVYATPVPPPKPGAIKDDPSPPKTDKAYKLLGISPTQAPAPVNLAQASNKAKTLLGLT